MLLLAWPIWPIQMKPAKDFEPPLKWLSKLFSEIPMNVVAHVVVVVLVSARE